MELTILRGKVGIRMWKDGKEGEKTMVDAWVCGPLCIHRTPPLYPRGRYTLTLTAEGIAVVSSMRIARWKLEEVMKLLVEMDGWNEEPDTISGNQELKDAVRPLYKYQ